MREIPHESKKKSSEYRCWREDDLFLLLTLRCSPQHWGENILNVRSLAESFERLLASFSNDKVSLEMWIHNVAHFQTTTSGFIKRLVIEWLWGKPRHRWSARIAFWTSPYLLCSGKYQENYSYRLRRWRDNGQTSGEATTGENTNEYAGNLLVNDLQIGGEKSEREILSWSVYRGNYEDVNMLILERRRWLAFRLMHEQSELGFWDVASMIKVRH